MAAFRGRRLVTRCTRLAGPAPWQRVKEHRYCPVCGCFASLGQRLPARRDTHGRVRLARGDQLPNRDHGPGRRGGDHRRRRDSCRRSDRVRRTVPGAACRRRRSCPASRPADGVGDTGIRTRNDAPAAAAAPQAGQARRHPGGGWHPGRTADRPGQPASFPAPASPGPPPLAGSPSPAVPQPLPAADSAAPAVPQPLPAADSPAPAVPDPPPPSREIFQLAVAAALPSPPPTGIR